MNIQRWLLRAAFVATLAGGSTACNQDNTANNGNQTDSLSTNQLTLKFDMSGDTAAYQDTVLFRTEGNKPLREDADVSKIVLSFPRFDKFPNTNVRDTLNRAIQRLMLLDEFGDIAYKSLQQRMTDFINDYESSKIEMAGLGAEFDAKWTCEVSIKVLLNTPNLLSLQFYESNFTGGAHANYTTRYLNYDLRTGKQLQLSDVLIANYTEQLRPIAELKFQQVVSAMELSASDFEFEDGTFTLPRNFAITRTGLLFSYDPYELGAFSMGTIAFEVPYGDIFPLLNREVLK